MKCSISSRNTNDEGTTIVLLGCNDNGNKDNTTATVGARNAPNKVSSFHKFVNFPQCLPGNSSKKGGTCAVTKKEEGA